MQNPLFSVLGRSQNYVRLREALAKGEGPVSVFGLGEAQRMHAASALHADLGGVTLFVTPSAHYAKQTLEAVSAYHPDAMLFPAREVPLNAHSFVQSQELTMQRMRVINRLVNGDGGFVIVASIEALMQRMVMPEAIAGYSRTVRVGMTIEPKSLLKHFIDAGYERVEVCEGRGQVTQRGGCIDIFPVTSDNPVRIEFFDDEVDTMREYDPLTQRSIENVMSISIPPATELPLTRDMRQKGIAALRKYSRYEPETEKLRAGGVPDNALALLPLFSPQEYCLIDYLPDNSIILIDEPARIDESAKYVYTSFMNELGDVLAANEGHPLQEGLVHTASYTIERLNTKRSAMLFAFSRSYNLIRPNAVVKFETMQIPKYMLGVQGLDDALRQDITGWKKKDYSVLVYAGEHAQRVKDLFAELDLEAPIIPHLEREIIPREVSIIGESIPMGFEYPELSLAVISEHELFGAEFRRQATAPKRSKNMLSLAELSPGDLIVHERHGIGRFNGVSSLTVDGKTRDYIELCYQGGDKVYIPTDQLDRVQKYIGGDVEKQKLSKLGSTEWQKTVARTRDSVKHLAFDLVKLYGERSRRKGFRFSPDTDWQRRLELSFPFNETPDQLSSIEEIKKDMESDRIMDRLLCGDVGYGKTEVALRAAFKCVMDGKQCAFLVPTTILAQQHYNTLTSRFADFPVRVELLSRFRTAAESREIKHKLENGEIDVIIGTHSLLAKDVKFYDLGLLIIDEEQRFGVNHKEQIKNMKQNVDVLTLSATPIPRTLHMSMSGIRDMSVIDTPPQERFPVQTYVTEYSDRLVREAILKELGRGGQVFYLYNNVKGMDLFAERLSKLVPEARVVYAHGQMPEQQLEKTMLDFIENRFDVLLCSTIIENGIDIRNANTLIVQNSDCFGLSQLYQLRGRIGRGSRLGYAYFTFEADKVLTETAAKRLAAIKQFTQFGSGFRIAMRDLEIRGAGELLGAEQHGHMEAVGYEMYCKLIDYAIKEAKGEPVKVSVDTVMEIPIDAYIPKKYITREETRMQMYRRIASVTNIDEMSDVQDEFIDRFGDIPKPVQNLLDISLYKARASNMGITKISVKTGEIRISIDSSTNIDPVKLVTNIPSVEGASVIGGSETAIVIKRRNKSVEEMFDAAKSVINTLMSFVDENKSEP